MAQCTLHVCWFLLHGFLPFELCYGCSLQPSRARAFGKVCILSPMKLGVLQTFIYLRRLNGWFTPRLQIILNANTVCSPLLGGCLVHLTTATLLTTEDGRLLSVSVVAFCTSTSERTLSEAMFVGSVQFSSMITKLRAVLRSMFHRMSWWIINLCMFLSVTQW